MLSHDEDRQLRAIEQWLEYDDPKLTRMLREHEAPERRRTGRVLRLVIDLIGAFLLVLGSVVASAAAVVFGVLILAVGGCMHLAARK